MKWAVALLFCLNLTPAADLGAAHSVFLMPMGHGLDQFIANRLTRMHVFQVVTDPAKADAIFTDHVDEIFEGKLKDLYPPPPDPAEEAKKAAKKEQEKEGQEVKAANSSGNGSLSILGDTANKPERAGMMGVGGRGRGTLFLVDVKSRQVLWSMFEKPKNNTPHELDHAAERVVKQLKQDLSPKTK